MPAANSTFPSYSAEQRQAEPPPMPDDYEPPRKSRQASLTAPDLAMPISAAMTPDEDDDDLAIAHMAAQNIHKTMSRVQSLVAPAGSFYKRQGTVDVPNAGWTPVGQPATEWPQEVEEDVSPFQGFGGRSQMQGSMLGGNTAPTSPDQPLVPRGMQGSLLDRRPPGNQPVAARWDRGTPTVAGSTSRYYERAYNRAQDGSKSDARRVKRLSRRFNVNE